METRQGAVPRKRRRRSAWILVSAVLVASAAGGGWSAGPTVMDALRKAAATTDALLGKVMWSLCGGALLARENPRSSIALGANDRLVRWVFVTDAEAAGIAHAPHDVFDVLAKSLGEIPDVPDPPLTTSAATAVFCI